MVDQCHTVSCSDVYRSKLPQHALLELKQLCSSQRYWIKSFTCRRWKCREMFLNCPTKRLSNIFNDNLKYLIIRNSMHSSFLLIICVLLLGGGWKMIWLGVKKCYFFGIHSTIYHRENKGRFIHYMFYRRGEVNDRLYMQYRCEWRGKGGILRKI